MVQLVQRRSGMTKLKGKLTASYTSDNTVIMVIWVEIADIQFSLNGGSLDSCMAINIHTTNHINDIEDNIDDKSEDHDTRASENREKVA